MKPTERIIELSKKMNELGYEKEINWGDWVITEHGVCIFCNRFEVLERKGIEVSMENGWTKDANEFIPIPSLADGLEWLRKTVDSLTIAQDIMVVEIEVNTDNKIRVLGSTPHEAVLKAMIKVLESKE